MESFLTIMWILAAVVQPGGDGYHAPAAKARFPLVAVVYALVALAAICVLGFRNAHRTHLDRRFRAAEYFDPARPEK